MIQTLGFTFEINKWHFHRPQWLLWTCSTRLPAWALFCPGWSVLAICEGHSGPSFLGEADVGANILERYWWLVKMNTRTESASRAKKPQALCGGRRRCWMKNMTQLYCRCQSTVHCPTITADGRLNTKPWAYWNVEWMGAKQGH